MTLPEFSSKLKNINIPWVVTDKFIYSPKYQKPEGGYTFLPSLTSWMKNRNLLFEELLEEITAIDLRSKLISENIIEIEFEPNHKIKLKCLQK